MAVLRNVRLGVYYFLCAVESLTIEATNIFANMLHTLSVI